MSNEKEVFSNILIETRKVIGEEDFAFGFSSVELITLKNGKLTFGVPAEFIKDFIEKNRKDLEAVAEQVGNITEIEIIISDQKNASDFYDQPIMEIEDKTQTSSNSKKKNNEAKTNARKNSGLNTNFTFDNFVVGDGNLFAHSIATVIAKNPGVAHNPCLFYGNVGLGKTHLLQAIGNEVFSLYPDKKVAFFSCEEFLTNFVEAIRTNDMKNFKNKTRKVDVLILDDIQFLTGKPSLQEELYHLFNFLLREEKQMIFSSDRPVHKIKDLEERLQSRFRSKMVADLQAPSQEMALGIIQNALVRNKERHNRSEEAFDIDVKVIDFIVERLRFNIRDMLGFIDRIVGYQDITNKKVDETLVRKWSAEYHPQRNLQKRNTIDNIVEATADFFDMPVKDIVGQKRNRQIARVRHIAMYLLKEMTKNSLTEIGKVFDVSHVSVSTAISKIEEEKTVDSELSETIEDIKEKIYRKDA